MNEARRLRYGILIALASTGAFSSFACGGDTSSVGSSGSGGSASGSGGASSDGGGSSGTAADAAADVPVTPPKPYDYCDVTEDCAWGEIDHEILAKTDCVCLFGCPYLPLSKTTVERRQTQYATLCTPGKDANGQPCPVDDCALPPPIACTNHTCGVAATDAGK